MTMIIDSHVHLVHGNAEHTRYSADEIIQIMDSAGVGKSVVFAMSVTPEEAFSLADNAAADYPDRLIPYAYALPSFDGSVIDILQKAVDTGFKGVKVHSGECPVSERTHVSLMEFAEQTGVPLLVDVCGKVWEAEWMAANFPKAKVIIAHVGQYRCREDGVHEKFINLAEKYPNTILDVSGVLLAWNIAEAVRRIGSDRVVWGSDGPHPYPTPEEFVTSDIQKIQDLDISDTDKKNILGSTISSLLF